ncbi:unnamed protein product [Allacma fusca]|uniref:Uncharacterized protein n=1 Tax=Allacma fusca TaxID=39272 RepID=A0A8J2J9R2_9HEXA|nr:unnamed protein product [Allacma fusca]
MLIFKITQNIMKRRHDGGVEPREEISAAKKAKTAKLLDKYPVVKFQNQHNRTEIESYLEKNMTLKTKLPASSKKKQRTPVFKKRLLSYVDKSTQTIQLKNCKCSCDH